MDPNSLIGTVVADQQILSLLGSGGMAYVYRSRQAGDPKAPELAVKIQPLPEHNHFCLAMNAANIWHSLKHPNITRLYKSQLVTLGEMKAQVWVMEKAEESLEDRLQRGLLTPAEGICITAHLASALDYLHSSARVVHRDIKSANLLCVKNLWKLSDFETLRAEGRTSLVVGTRGMLPVEAFSGEVLYANDMWAAGRTLNRALQGNEGADPSKLPEPLRSIVKGCLLEDPMQRWTAAQVLVAIGASRKSLKPWQIACGTAAVAACALVASALDIEYLAAARNLSVAFDALARSEYSAASEAVERALTLVPDSRVAQDLTLQTQRLAVQPRRGLDFRSPQVANSYRGANTK